MLGCGLSSGNYTIVERETLRRVDLDINWMEKLLRVLPDLACVRTEGEPEADQI